MTRHVSAEKLARFRDGFLSRAATRRVTAHLARCAGCQADADALARLPALLASTQPPPLPDHLAARIETALAAESARRAARVPAPSPAADPGPGRPAPAREGSGRRGPGRRSDQPRWVVTDERSRRRARQSSPALRILAAAAVVAVLGGGGYELVNGLGGASSDTSGSSSARSAAGPAIAPAPQSSTGGFHSAARPPSGSVGGVGPGAVSAPELGPVEQYSHAGHSGSFTPVRTSTNYLAAHLGQQASAALVRLGPFGPLVDGPPGTSHSSAGLGVAPSAAPSRGSAGAFSAATLARLPGCIGRVAAGQSVLLVDVATFQGAPAIIIVTAPPGSTTATQVWAVGAGCSSSAADVLAHQRVR